MTSPRVRPRWPRLLFGALLLLMALVFIGFLLPAQARVERRVEIRGPATEVFARVATLRRWPDWTAWTTNRFPDMQVNFEGPESGVGAVMVAAGKSSGDGRVTLLAAGPVTGIRYRLDFNHGFQLFDGTIRWEAAGDALTVTWTVEGDMGWNPLRRWGGLFLGALMGGDMDVGLAKLQRQVEAAK